jgi:CRISPR-associated protein Csm4
MKDKLTALKFRFTTPLHIGTVRADYDKSEKMIHSDTLYSAIIWAWNVLGIEIPELLDESGNPKDDLGFTISSLFPYYQGKESGSKPIYFFPKPIGTLTTDKSKHHKKVKSIRYLDIAALKECFNGEPFLYDAITEEDKGDVKSILTAETSNIGGFKLRNGILSKDDKLPKSSFIVSEVYPRVYVPRYGEVDKKTGEAKDTEIYYIERLFFKEKSGLYCLAQFDNDTIKQKVIAALRFLADEGLGTDKHVGNGLFELECEDFTGFEDLKIESNHAVSLSLFCPENKEQLKGMLGEQSAFDTMKRGGWITEEGYLTYRKKSVYMFTEGSIFKTDDKPKGKTVDLKPENKYLPSEKPVTHPIYRVGRSLFLPIKLPQENY